MAQVLFPARQRCKRCAKALGRPDRPEVFWGLYCSPRCAGMAAPATTPAAAPRECKTQRDGRWVFKRRYRSVEEIPDVLRSDPSTSWYCCNHCGHWHIGHTRMGDAEKFRMFADPEHDLADTLVKLRGKATVAQVAKAAGVRPIRLKELETGVGHAEGMKTLGKVLHVYGVRLGISMGARR